MCHRTNTLVFSSTVRVHSCSSPCISIIISSWARSSGEAMRRRTFEHVVLFGIVVRLVPDPARAVGAGASVAKLRDAPAVMLSLAVH